jgi:hypothetical protein
MKAEKMAWVNFSASCYSNQRESLVFTRTCLALRRIILTWDNFTIVWMFFFSIGDELEFGMMYRTKFLFRCITSSDSLCRLVIIFYVLFSRYKDARNIWGSAHVHIKLIRYQFLCVYLELATCILFTQVHLIVHVRLHAHTAT